LRFAKNAQRGTDLEAPKPGGERRRETGKAGVFCYKKTKSS
jgi:hypothetical protein